MYVSVSGTAGMWALSDATAPFKPKRVPPKAKPKGQGASPAPQQEEDTTPPHAPVPDAD